jgi:hypothetical protein
VAVRETLSDRAYEAQSALSTIKSFAYGGVATEHEVRVSIAQLREQTEAMERVVNGQAQELLPR